MPPPPPPPPHLMDELIEECLLRLPPYEPASLVRAALVCKRWRRILADRGFRRRFRELHHGGGGRTAPMLGFLHVPTAATGGSSCVFTPTSGSSSFRPRNAAAADLRGRRAIDSRHGRVLLAAWPFLHSNLAVWDPITGEQVDLPDLPPSQQRHPTRRFIDTFNSRAAVLCAAAAGAAACDHVDCHRGHFVVVLMQASQRKVRAHVYSSQAGAWSQTAASAAQQDLGDDDPRRFFHFDPCALAGNTLYFRVHAITGTSRLLKYDLGAQEIGFVNLPPDCADRRCRILLMTTREDGGLGFARVDNSKLHLWSMDDGLLLGWTPSGTT